MANEKEKIICPSCETSITDSEAVNCPKCGANLDPNASGGIDSNFIMIFACTFINIFSCFLKWNHELTGLEYSVCAFILVPNIILFVFMFFELFKKIRCCNLLLIAVPLISLISVFAGGLMGLDVPYKGGWNNKVISFGYVSIGFYMLVISSLIGFISSLFLVSITVKQGRPFLLIETIKKSKA